MRLILLLLAVLIAGGCDRQKAEVQQGDAVADAIPTKGIDRSRAGRPLPDSELRDADDEEAALASIAGEPVLVNLWATWCAPCVKELPTLEALSRRDGAPRVIAVSQDMAPRSSVNAFVEKLRLAELEVWHDPQMALAGALDAQILPTTILYDANGREVWRYVGDLDWAGEEASRLLAEGGAARPD
ncbi:MAG TPA: TlpA disulfide reductase family protein [Sphingomicrobium sp.]|nr:TlpA disulfide reductase family protein [Sphingomicrobium sp.]